MEAEQNIRSMSKPRAIKFNGRDSSSPVAVAFYAHGMAAVGQNHLGAGFKADPALILPVQINVR